ncbi:DUF892 family protein [Winogradskyella bathintestinalis]|uniref:DUF892 family protein n=1 Tax=Winogradskyella bathintestinalis TaxID=3035208 RepID=A0ABT7ZRU2_9FLAO|nr:DUF892 family protein [Winogradskyella bathintestinalis]MDN3491717.1 DUF892 family protein [Winogradskyella bathintestinalis]
MESLKDLFEKEFKNLYALEKQIQDTLETLKSPRPKELKANVEEFKKNNTSDFNTVQSIAQNLSINPGNTVDSVAQEMLTNISEIADMEDIPNRVRNAGLVASLYRLVSYKTVNYYSVRQMAKALNMKHEARLLRPIKVKNANIEYNLKVLARKKVFKKAAK